MSVIPQSSAQVTIYSGSNADTYNLPTGVSKLSVANAVGGIRGKIVRSGNTVKIMIWVVHLYFLRGTPSDYNLNHSVALIQLLASIIATNRLGQSCGPFFVFGSFAMFLNRSLLALLDMFWDPAVTIDPLF
nr:hypothetical protein L203_01176 [Cryptococcus depauperatus CBS 7841]